MQESGCTGSVWPLSVIDRAGRWQPRLLGVASSFVVAGALLGLAVPAQAGVAEPRYAAPDGTGAACTQAEPCPITTAVNDGPAGGQILLESGTYALGGTGLIIQNGKSVDPVDPTNPPLITVSAFGPGVRLTGTAPTSLADVRIEAGEPNNNALFVDGGEHVAERLQVEQTNNQNLSAGACYLQSGVLRDSVCWNTGNGPAVSVEALVEGFSADATVRNVTGVSEDEAGLALSAGNGADAELNARNSIFSGPFLDIRSNANSDGSDPSASSVDADLDFSNYADVSTMNFGTGTSTVTPAGTRSNQTATPAFVDSAAGDFHQAEGSPTLESGTEATTLLGSLDFERQDRVQGTIDIGADEARGDVARPSVRIISAPAKRSRDRTPTFRFRGSDDVTPASEMRFRCKLDARPFTSCASPKQYRNVKPGRHTFRVRAIDESGKSSPLAGYSWRVLRRR